MAHDAGAHGALRRDDPVNLEIEDRRMFGGLCIMVRANMVSGTDKTGALFRVARPNMAAALALPRFPAL